MEADFWHRRWEKGEIGFHLSDPHPLMVRNFPLLSLPSGGRIFVPLCGKTRDISWFLSKGFQVSGVDLSRVAVEQLFADLGVSPEISTVGDLQLFRSDGIEIFVGDFFNLTADQIGEVAGCYDRAALVALPPDMRAGYGAHLYRMTKGAPQLLICFEYDQSLIVGPPFSIDREEIDRVHGSRYKVKLIERVEVAGGVKGICPGEETVWLLEQN